MNDDAKQRLIVAQSCVKAAAEFMAVGDGHVTNADVLETATLFYEWCWQQAGPFESPMATIAQVQANPTIPIPAGATPVPPTNEIPVPNCDKCGGPMWDNRVGKKNPKAPDFKCKNKACANAIWLTPFQA